MEETKRVKSEVVRYIPWTNERENPAWFNHPLDCFLVRFEEDEGQSAAEGTSENSKLVMFCSKGSDLWQKTCYGFERDSGHAFLGTRLEQGRAIQVGFSVVSFKGQFDQGGVLIRENANSWLKAGVELSDGVLQLSAVHTRHGMSDWSTSAWPSEWKGKENVLVQVSRVNDSMIIRIKLMEDNDPWRLLRVCPISLEAPLLVGPYSCAPTRDGLYVEFLRYVECEATPLH